MPREPCRGLANSIREACGDGDALNICEAMPQGIGRSRRGAHRTSWGIRGSALGGGSTVAEAKSTDLKWRIGPQPGDERIGLELGTIGFDPMR